MTTAKAILKSTEKFPIGRWADNEKVEVIEEIDAGIVVRILNELLARGFVQPLAKEHGYPCGYLIVNPENLY